MNIWHNEQDWPKDFGDYLFLGRAVRMLGEARFPNEWTDSDPAREPVVIPEPRQSSVRPSKHILSDPTRRPPPAPGAAALLRQREEAAKELARRAQASNAAYARFCEVKGALIQWFSEKSVRTYSRKHSGGNFSDIDSFLWNGERIDHRFSSAKINTDDAYKPILSYSEQDSSWIFVSRNDIDRRIGKESSTLGEDIHIPEILKFAMSIVHKRQKDIMDPLLDKGALKYIVTEEWPSYLGSIRPGTVDAIAKVLRPIRAQLGTANPDRMASLKTSKPSDGARSRR